MAQSEPPDQLGFLKAILENIKDLRPEYRFILIILILLIFAFLFNVAIPPEFVYLFYFALAGGLVLYLFWEWQQRKAREGERRDELEAKKLELDTDLRRRELDLKYDDRKHQREYDKPAPPVKNAPQPPHDLQKAYLDHLLSQVSQLSLLGIDPAAAADAHAADLSLSQVYTALLTADGDEMEKLGRLADRPGREPRRVSALAQLDRHPRLVLLGDPGSGKSTFVNFVAMCLAGQSLGLEAANLDLLTAPLPDDKGEDEQERQPWSLGALLPLRIVLRDFAARGLPDAGRAASERDLWKFVRAELEREEDGLAACVAPLQNAFAEGRGLLLLDGLDEVPEDNERTGREQRKQIKQVVESFARQYQESRILVTSRTYAYQKQDWQLAGFTATELLPFSDGQIRRFVDGWYVHTASLRDMEAAQAQKRAADLKQAIFSRPHLYELARRPLLLTLTASLHAWRMGELPDQRQKLYEDVVDLLLERWEKRQKVWDGQQEQLPQPSLAEWLNTDRQKVRALLNRLAYEAHANQSEEDDAFRTADIAQKELVDGLMALADNPDAKPGQLLIYLRDRAGLLAARGEGVFTFPHRTFQEYMAACHLTDHEEYPDVLAQLAREQPNRWREVLLLAGAKTAATQANSVWDMADALLPATLATEEDTPHALWGAHLAGQLLAETADPAKPLSDRNQGRKTRVLTGLLLCLSDSQLPAAERALAGQSLGLLGDPRPEALEVDRMPFCFIPGGPFQMGSSRYEDAAPHLNEWLAADYWLGQWPVTNAQFAAFVRAGGYKEARYWPEARKANRWRDNGTVHDLWGIREQPNNFGRPYNLPNHPVVGVTWYEALAFCRWLTARWRVHLPAGYGVALPSEAEWEKGARGGLTVPATPLVVRPGDWQRAAADAPNPAPERHFPWGEAIGPDLANTKETTINATNAPGCFPRGASPYGCQEMSGNVWEWTRSLWGAKYPYVPNDGREDLTAGDTTGRVIRGGAYNWDLSDCGCGRRDWYNPHFRFDHYGFRVAVSPFVSGL